MSYCGNPAVETEALMSRRLKFDKSRYCVKCKTNAGNIVIRHAVYCKECFSPLQITKFKRSLEPCINPASLSSSGPRRMKLKATGNLTIGFSGGLGSTVLLDLVRRCYFPSSEEIADGEIQGKHKGGTKHPRNQNVWNEARVCYVEICGAFPESEVQDRTEEVRKVVETYESFEFIPLRIESAFDPKWWEMVGGRDELKERELGVDLSDEELVLSSLQNSPSNTSISPKAALRAHLSRLPTMTATQSTITTLTRLILLYTAHSTSSSHLLLGTTLTGLSIGLISGIAMGGGFVVREEAGEEWAPKVNGNKSIEPSVKVVRPLKDMGMKECAAWVWWNQLNVVGKEKVAGGKQGIGGLTKDFVVGLERDYPSTVSTIARTCGKLAPKDAASERCAMCERPAQKGVQDWKARISIRSFSTPGTDTSIPPPHIPPSTLKSSTLLEKPPSSLSLTPHLCYACHTTLTSRSSRGTALLQSRNLNTDGQLPSTTPLPLWVNSHLRDPIVPHSNGADVKGEIWHGKMLGRADMRDQVKDFILDD